MNNVHISIRALKRRGVEVLKRRGFRRRITLPTASLLEAPCSLKKTEYAHSLRLGAFSYQVSGYCFGARIGRYCSFGEQVQIGRQNHPLDWGTTSPALYSSTALFDVGHNFAAAAAYHDYVPQLKTQATKVKITHIGHDVWIGHMAYIAAGIRIGNGAVIGAYAVVTKDVPDYAVVAGNPAVVKRFRLPKDQIAAMQASRWWRYAPWQLQHLDPSDVFGFCDGVAKMEGMPVFEPSLVNLSEEKL